MVVRDTCKTIIITQQELIQLSVITVRGMSVMDFAATVIAGLLLNPLNACNNTHKRET